MSDAAAPIPTRPFFPVRVRFDRDGRLDADLACVLCGHNLRGLRADGRCGECGDPVSNSLLGAALYVADVQWLERVRFGVASLAVIWVWFWLPIVWWLIYAQAVWCITTQDRARKHVPSKLKSGCLRAVAILLAVVGPTLPVLAWKTGFAASLPRLGLSLPIIVALANVIVLAALRPILVAANVKRLATSNTIGLILALIGFLFLFLGAATTVAAQFNLLGAATAVAAPFNVLFLTYMVIGFGFVAVSFLRTLPLLFRAWRLLETATFQSRALRTERKCWQRGIPGAFTSPAAASARSA